MAHLLRKEAIEQRRLEVERKKNEAEYAALRGEFSVEDSGADADEHATASLLADFIAAITVSSL